MRRAAGGQVQPQLSKTGPAKHQGLSLSFLETKAKRETTLIVIGLSLSKEEKVVMFAKKSKLCPRPHSKETFIPKSPNKGQRTTNEWCF